MDANAYAPNHKSALIGIGGSGSTAMLVHVLSVNPVAWQFGTKFAGHWCVSLVLSRFSSHKEATMVRVKGVVIPVDWDEEGNVLSLALAGYDEDEYWIDHRSGSIMEGLTQIVGRQVELEGEIKRRRKRKIIKVANVILRE